MVVVASVLTGLVRDLLTCQMKIEGCEENYMAWFSRESEHPICEGAKKNRFVREIVYHKPVTLQFFPSFRGKIENRTSIRYSLLPRAPNMINSWSAQRRAVDCNVVVGSFAECTSSNFETWQVSAPTIRNVRRGWMFLQ